MRSVQLLQLPVCAGICAILLAALSCAAGAAAPPEMVIQRIAVERFLNDDAAAVSLKPLEINCHSATSSQWSFSFAGFQTRWRDPIELEVTGSGKYQLQDIFSIAAVSLDYGTKGGWSERSFFGLGRIQATRSPHPPSWGVGSSGKFVMRGNLLDASSSPQRLTIDPEKYAPDGWDGRLWIGLVLHNAGKDRWLRMRILNAASEDSAPSGDMDGARIRKLMQENQTQFLEAWLKEISAAGEVRRLSVPRELSAYFDKDELASGQVSRKVVQAALDDSRKEVLSADRFLDLTGAYFDGPRREAAARASVQAARSLVNAWRDGGSVGEDLGCMVRLASNMEKPGLRDLSSGRLLTTEASPVRISAARNEHEAFQIILTALDGVKGRVMVQAEDLKGKAGRIPASCLTINAVGYVRIFPGGPGERLLPDPLLIGDIPPPKAGENQPVWVSLHVPLETAEGVYKGKISVVADRGGEVAIPLEVTVRSFEIPKKISLRSSFWLFRDQLNRFYHKDEIALDDYLKWVDFALEHRLCPVDVYEGQCEQLLDIVTEDASGQLTLPNPHPDWSKWDRYMQHMVDGGASTAHLGTSHHQGAFFADKENPVSSAGQVARVIQSLKTMERHYREKGWFDLHYVQLRDETSAPDSLNVYKAVHAEMPELKLLLTAPSGDARPYLRIPCPLTPSFDASWRDEAHSKRDEYWWYVCLVPKDPHANFFIFQTIPQHRALFWQTWKYGVDGLLYWGLNFWSGYGHRWPENAKGPTARVPGAADPNFCPIPADPGDGFSMYPGPKAGEPMSSLRLEAMRDGEEDYEYLVLLDRLIREASRRSPEPPALKEAQSAREEAAGLTRSLTDYEQSPSSYLHARDRIARAIEALSRVVKAL